MERTNSVLKTMIRSFIGQDHRDWDVHINDFRFAYNSSLHSTNKTTPAYLNLGKELLPRKTFRGLVEGEVDLPDPNLSVWTDRMSRMRHLWELITTYQDQAFTKQAKYYDRRHRVLQFKVGDLVKKPNNVLSSTKRYGLRN